MTDTPISDRASRNDENMLEVARDLERELKKARKNERRYLWIRDKAVPESIPDLIMALPQGTDEVIDECIAESEKQ